MDSRVEHAAGIGPVRCEHLELRDFCNEMRASLDELLFTEVWTNVGIGGVRTRYERAA
jgi:hypothetical protein